MTLGLFHARACKIVGMEQNPYQSPTPLHERPPPRPEVPFNYPLPTEVEQKNYTAFLIMLVVIVTVIYVGIGLLDLAIRFISSAPA